MDREHKRREQRQLGGGTAAGGNGVRGAAAEAAMPDPEPKAVSIARAQPAERRATDLALQIELETQNAQLRRTERQLCAIRDHYHELYDLAPVPYVTLDRGGRIVEANRAAAALLGLERAQLVERPLSALLRQDQAELLDRHLAQVFDSGHRCSCELSLRGADAQELRVLLNSSALAGAAGEGHERCAALVELTARAAVAQSSGDSAAALSNAILDQAPHAILCTDLGGRIERFNRAAEQLFGCRADEVVGEPIARLMTAASAQRFDERVRDLSSASAQRLEGAGLRSDGTEVPLELSLSLWPDGAERKVAAFIRDSSEHKRSARALRDSERRLRLIAEHVEDVFMLASRDDGRVLYASPGFERVYGRGLAELYAADAATRGSWIHPEDRPRVAAAYANYCRGDPYDEEYRIRRPDGELRWIRIRGFPIEEGGEDIRRDVYVLQDITGERHLEAELRQAQKMETLGTLAAGVAHDFNNVLQGILGCISVARSTKTPPERARLFLDRGAEAARRGGELATLLMAFARKQQASPPAVAIDALIQGMALLIERLVTEEVKLQVRTAAPCAKVCAEPAQIEQILLNLAANARDAMESGGTLWIGTRVIRLKPAVAKRYGLDASRPHVSIVVQDSGKGMDEPTRARIFEPFFTTKPVGKGTGLGLSTVHAVARQIGGHVSVHSSRRKGTRFTLLFPCNEQHPSEARAGARPGAGAADELSADPTTVLLVEDERLVRVTVQQYLEELGHEVLTAASGAHAQRVCGQFRGRIDVLLADVILPGMQGPALGALLGQRYPGLVALYMSADPSVTAETVGQPVLRKPFGKQEVAAAIAAVLGA